MTWAEQADGMMKAWTEAQKTMWQGWYDMMQVSSTPAMLNPSLFEQWRVMATQGQEMWTSNAQPLPQNMAAQFLASQAAMMRVLELTTRAWQAVAPKIDSGEDWQATITGYAEKLREQMNPKNMVDMNQDVNTLWQVYMQQMQVFGKPWADLMQRAPSHMGNAMATNSNAELIEITKLYANAYDQTFGKLLLSPSVGFTRELEEKLSKAFDTWKTAQQAGNDYQLLMSEAWGGVFEEVMKDLVQRAEDGKPVESMRDLMRIWTDSADKSFQKVFSSKAYAETQGRFVNATMIYRTREQAVMDELLKTMNLPNRTEVDEAHRNVYELRKEVKELKKAMKLLQKTQKPAPASKSTASVQTSQS